MSRFRNPSLWFLSFNTLAIVLQLVVSTHIPKMATSIRNMWTQSFPPTPTFTESEIPSMTGKVFLVTGGSDGIGSEIVKILYSKGAKVYIASRSKSKADTAIKTITAAYPSSAGQLVFLALDLSDLSSVRQAASTFLKEEEKLDVLWNNAAIGVNALPNTSRTAQSHEMHIGTNCLGPYLLTKLLLPKLKVAAKIAPAASVRIVWASSAMVDSSAPKGGLVISSLDKPTTDQVHAYSVSKAGNWLLASEFARRVKGDGIVSITQNPGNLSTHLIDGMPKIVQWMIRPMLYEAKMGAYTNLWAGLNQEVTMEDGGKYVVPWGRWHEYPRKDIELALKSESEGGTGEAEGFWKWCEERTKEFEN